MDIDFDKQPSDLAATSARAGAKFKPKGRPQLRKHVSVSTSSTLFDDAKEKLSTQPSVAHTASESLSYSSLSEILVPDNDMINQSSHGTFSKENVDVLSGGFHCCMEPTDLHARTDVDSEKERCNDIDMPMFLDNPRTQDLETLGDFVSPEVDEVMHAQTKTIQPEEEESRLDLESLKIVREGTSTYGQHTEKFQPKRRFHGNVMRGQNNHGVNEEAYEPHYSSNDIGHMSTDSSGPSIVNEQPRNEAFNTNTNFYANLQEENFPQVPQETVPKMATGNSPHGCENEERVGSPSNNTVVGEDGCYGNTVEEQSGRERNVRRSKRATSEKNRPTQKRKRFGEEANQCSQNPPKKKKFKHSTPRQKRSLEKELLEIPDDEIRFLPIRDLLRLVDYKEWLEKKEAKGGKGSKSQESSSKAPDNQYSQDDTEDFGSDECTENQESSRVKPDSPVNYQTYLHKTARSRWSKQDTELFYEGIREFGSDLSMVQQLFPNRSRQQLKLKYKLEERKHPLKLNDTLTSRSEHHIHYENVIKKFQQEAAAQKAEEEDEAETASEGATEAEAEAETNDVAGNETTGDAQVEAENSSRWDGEKVENDHRSNGEDDGEDDDDADDAECDYWDFYKSDM